MAKKKRLKFTRITKYFNPDYENSIQARLRNPQTRLVLSLLCILISFFLLISFTSYLFTWKIDQDKVFSSTQEYVLGGDKASNLLGRFGAIISHAFFYNGFGLGSYLFAFIILSFAGKLMTNSPRIKLKNILFYSMLALAWLSPAFAYFFSNSDFAWGGAFGDYVSGWLVGFVGSIGTFFILMFIPLIFSVIQFKIDFSFLQFLKKERKPDLPGFENELDADGFEMVGYNNGMELSLSEKEGTLNGAEPGSDTPAYETTEITTEGPVEISAPEEQQKESNGLELSIDASGTDQEELKDNNEEELELAIEEVTEDEFVDTESDISNNFDPTKDLSGYNYPALELLDNHGSDKIQINKEELERNKDQIVNTLNNYKIQIDKIKATIGPTITLYEIVPAPGTRISKIKNLEDDIALSLAALGIRIIAPIPGKGTIGIEVPNEKKEVVAMKTVLASEKFVNAKMDLPLVLGKTISNEVYVTDLAKAPHMLIAGATGQGKSVGINSILISLLYKKHPSQLKLVLVDPKKVELSIYKKIERHFLAKLPNEEESIITDTKKVIYTLNSLCIEMDQRYDLLKKALVRNIKEYNEKFTQRKLNPQKGHRFLPYIVLVIDEFADLIMTAGKEVETPIARLAQLARAIGIHLIIATQRPSVNIITGMIKANFPTRIAFKVTSKIDSRTILDASGADQLIGRGDMLFAPGSEIIRLQCPFVDTPEVDRIVDFIGDQKGYPVPFELPEYVSEDGEGNAKEFDPNQKDALFEDAARTIVAMQSGSTSMLQRRLQLGYNRAGRIMDQLEAAGIVGPPEGSKPREVLVSTEVELDNVLETFK